MLPESRAVRSRSWRRFCNNRTAVISAWVLGLSCLMFLLWPWVRHSHPTRITELQFAPPSVHHWFGTDFHGRDLFSRVMSGAAMSLCMGVAGATVSLVIGVSWGAVAGYTRGRVDAVMMRTVDVLYSLPSIIFVVVLINTFESILKQRWGTQLSADGLRWLRVAFLLAGLGAMSWLTMARIVRGQVLSLRERPFVLASRALGAGPVHILRHHILPNILGIVIVYTTLTIPTVVLYESFLSFLGLGIQPPEASLGSLIAEGAMQINSIRIYWWLIAFPSAVLVSLLMSLSFFGDGLRDALEVRDTSV